MITGSQVKFLRQSQGLTQFDLAHKMDIRQQRLSAIEMKKKDLNDAATARVLKALNLSIEKAKEILKHLQVVSSQQSAVSSQQSAVSKKGALKLIDIYYEAWGYYFNFSFFNNQQNSFLPNYIA